MALPVRSTCANFLIDNQAQTGCVMLAALNSRHVSHPLADMYKINSVLQLVRLYPAVRAAVSRAGSDAKVIAMSSRIIYGPSASQHY